VTQLVIDPDGVGQALEIEPTTGAYVAGMQDEGPRRLVAYDADGDIIDEAELRPPEW